MPFSFTHSSYGQLLRDLRDRGYSFCLFDEIRSGNTREPFCVIRHDCDNDLKASLEMAQIERAEDVRSTYFFMLRAEMYNLLSPAARKQARSIVDLGHVAGLHFDESAYMDLSSDEVRSAVNQERTILANELGVPVNVVSFHQPASKMLDRPYALDCVNATDLLSLDLAYISDSNCGWRVGDPVGHIDDAKPRRLQILMHPEWWTDAPVSVADKWALMVRNNVERILISLEQREASYTMRHEVDIVLRGA